MKLSSNLLVSIIIGMLLTLLLVYGLGIGDKSKSGPFIAIASTNIDAGNLISEANTKFVQWSSADVPENSFSSIKELQGRVARQVIFAGEPVLNVKLAPTGSKAGMESLITIGKRAITVRVNDVVGVAGFALPGSYVDIIANFRDDQGQSYSKVVLKRIRVLAVAQETDVDSNKAKVVNAVTLELTPVESEQLDLARSVGTLSLALRNELDKSDVDSKGVNVNDLLSGHTNQFESHPQKVINMEESDSVPQIATAPVEPVVTIVEPVVTMPRKRQQTERLKVKKAAPVEELRGLNLKQDQEIQ